MQPNVLGAAHRAEYPYEYNLKNAHTLWTCPGEAPKH